MPKRKQTFQTIRSEGAILPPDLLQRVAGLEVEGVRPADYHLPEGLKLNEEISRAWNRLQAYWKAFKEDRERILDSDNSGGVTTRDKWLLPLFQELGYGRLTTSKSPEIDGRSYPVERFYSHVPLHLIGCKLPLDKRTPGARGAATASPHSLVQEFLNRSDEHLWAFLSNGLQLRILRDNYSLSRQSYVEFDLEAMMEGEVYADFALLWLLCHQSRVEADKAEECWLEKWSKLAHEQGTRVLEELRDGVQKSIEALGVGFLAHKANSYLRDKLKSGDLTTQDYYRQLLRIVYRLLFLFVAEDRELLHPRPDENAAEDERRQFELACSTYDEHYSLRRLRDLAERVRGSKHADLWHTLSLVFDALSRPKGLPELALPGLGSFLWNPESTTDLLGPIPEPPLGRPEPVYIANHHLLDAVRALAFTVQNRTLRAVDYKNLGSEELGSVYESLLELVPTINPDGRSFSLRTTAGSERKTSGSYYTPDSLVQCLLDSALEPVVADRMKPCKTDEERDQAILSIKVCDPAVGSGHFLIAAAHRLARHLARIRCGESEPTPDIYQHALRDVIRRCVYGVDLNPMAAELCKVALWMESIDPGKPLTFLDAHIQVGNSLLGTTPRLLSEGIPDDAFKSIEGDVKSVASELKKQNKKEHKDKKSAIDYLFEPTIKLGNLPAEWVKISDADDDSVNAVAATERRYTELVSGSDYQNARLLADTWCSAFVWMKDKSDLGQNCPTEREFRRIEANPHSILPDVKSEVRRLAVQYQFFHWHLAFPDVFRLPGEGEAENEQTGWNNGFDVVLGNPPWERIQVESPKFFATYRPDMLKMKRSERNKAIEALNKDDPQLYRLWKDERRVASGTTALLKRNGVMTLSTTGNVNSYGAFVELGTLIIDKVGHNGMIAQSGIATDDSMKALFSYLMESKRLASLFDFENRHVFFQDVHPQFKFCLLTIGGRGLSFADTHFLFFGTSTNDIHDSTKVFSLTADDIKSLNPNTQTCPIFRNAGEALIAQSIYRLIPVLQPDSQSDLQADVAWDVHIQRMYDMAYDASEFVTAAEIESDQNCDPFTSLDWKKLYEAKFLHQFDHRFATCEGEVVHNQVPSNVIDATSIQKSDPNFGIATRYFVSSNGCTERFSRGDWEKSWIVAGRQIARASDERTSIFTVVPQVGVSNSCYTFRLPSHSAIEIACFVCNLNTYSFDWLARQKVGGANFSVFIVRQLPVLRPSDYPRVQLSSWSLSLDWIAKRALELIYTAWDLEPFALDCDYAGPPFRWDEERRYQLRCELDAAYFHLYLGSSEDWGRDSSELHEMFPTPRDAVDYIMETFPIVKKKDMKRTEVKDANGEVTTEGTYITKDTILAIYDEMQEAIDSGQPYQSRLDPPPGPPADEKGDFIPVSEWDSSSWPTHIHTPKEKV